MASGIRHAILSATLLCFTSLTAHAGMTFSTISPNEATPSDPLTILVLGQQVTTCVANERTLAVQGSAVTLTITMMDEGFCNPAVTPWSVEHPVGPLPAGNYTLSVRLISTFECDQGSTSSSCFQVTPFSVQDPGGPGTIPPTLSVRLLTPLRLLVEWDAGCSPDAFDYALYRGTLGDFGSPSPVVCTDAGGNRVEAVDTIAEDTFFIVVPHDGFVEGSPGTHSDEMQRDGYQDCRPAHAGPDLVCPD